MSIRSEKINDDIEAQKILLNEAKLKFMKEAFDVFDVSNKGYIDFKYLRILVEGLGFTVTTKEVFKNLESMDGLGTNQTVSFDIYMDLSKRTIFLYCCVKIHPDV